MTEVLGTDSHITKGMQGFCMYAALMGSTNIFCHYNKVSVTSHTHSDTVPLDIQTELEMCV